MKTSSAIRRISLPTAILAICLTSLFYTGCRNPEYTASMELHLDTTSRTLVPENTPLFVESYEIDGTGPEEHTFAVRSTKSVIAIEGLVPGQWSLHVLGRNKNGTALVSGETSVELEPDKNTITMELNTMVGTGTLDIDISWDPKLISYSDIEILLTDESGLETHVKPTTFSPEEGQALLNTSLPSGSYTMNIQLMESGAFRTGHVTAVRIVDGLVTEGMITLNLNEPTHPPYSFILINTIGVPISCHIDGADDDLVVCDTPLTTKLVADDGLDTDTLDISWFLNGIKLGDGASITFTPPQGHNRLDVIAQGPQKGTTGSTGWQFIATRFPSIPGVPLLLDTYNRSQDEVLTGGKTRAAFLDKNTLVLASSASHSLQVCRILHDSLQSLSIHGVESGWNVGNITDIMADPVSGRFLVAESDVPDVSLYQYKDTAARISRVFSVQGGSAEQDFSRTERLGRYAHTETEDQFYALLCNPDGKVTPAYDLRAKTEKEWVKSALKWPPNPDMTVYPYLTIVSPGEHAAMIFSRQENRIRITQRETGALYYTRVTPFGDGTKNPQDLSGLTTAVFINDYCALVAHGSYIERYENTMGTTWAHTESYQAGGGLFPHFTALYDMVLDATGTLLFASTQEGPILSFSVSASGELTYLGQSETPGFTAQRLYPSPGGQWLVATGDEDAVALYALTSL